MQQAVNSQVKKSGGITDMDEHSLRRVLLARYYLHLANEQMKSESESAKFAAINLFHEALETTLFTCAAHLNAKVSERGGIENYIDGINAKIDGKELPLRRRILQFNKARVSAKHHLTFPEDNFFSIIRTTVPEFIQEAVNLTFCKDFYAVSLAELIEDSEVGSYISQAQADFSSGKYYDCLAEVRKAFYVQFEKQYDVRKFEDPEKAKARGLLSEFSICRAPYHAKNPEYIRDRVSRPSDFIVFDHSALGSELMREGIDVQTFWNIWRLTPGVYHEEDGQWTVEYDFDLADDQQIRENCIYVLDNLIAITLHRQARRKRTRIKAGAYRCIQTVPNAPLYKKAMRESEEAARLPDGIRRVNITRSVPALDGLGRYWEASYLRQGGPFLVGYLHHDDTEGEPESGFVADGVDIVGGIFGSLPSSAGDA